MLVFWKQAMISTERVQDMYGCLRWYAHLLAAIAVAAKENDPIGFDSHLSILEGGRENPEFRKSGFRPLLELLSVTSVLWETHEYRVAAGAGDIRFGQHDGACWSDVVYNCAAHDLAGLIKRLCITGENDFTHWPWYTTPEGVAEWKKYRPRLLGDFPKVQARILDRFGEIPSQLGKTFIGLEREKAAVLRAILNDNRQRELSEATRKTAPAWSSETALAMIDRVLPLIREGASDHPKCRLFFEPADHKSEQAVALFNAEGDATRRLDELCDEVEPALLVVGADIRIAGRTSFARIVVWLFRSDPIPESDDPEDGFGNPFDVVAEGISRFVARVVRVDSQATEEEKSETGGKGNHTAKPRIPGRYLKAFRAFELAESCAGKKLTIPQAWEHLQNDTATINAFAESDELSDYTIPPTAETFGSYVGKGRSALGQARKMPKRGRTGRSIVRPDGSQ
jgi:hypothetical protein